jgi:catechol 2,3-dioxygenase-like lactoylglutathione lyase family enzyme
MISCRCALTTPQVRNASTGTGSALMHVLRLNHVQLPMPPGGEDRARAFYRKVRGLRQIPQPPVLAARGGVWFEIGELQLHLGVESDFRPARKAHPALDVSDFDALAVHCEAADHTPHFDDELSHLRRFNVDDPFGNRLEFIAAVPGGPAR